MLWREEGRGSEQGEGNRMHTGREQHICKCELQKRLRGVPGILKRQLDPKGPGKAMQHHHKENGWFLHQLVTTGTCLRNLHQGKNLNQKKKM